MAFPTALTNAVDDTTDVIAAHLNNLEAKVGIDASAVVSSLDYLKRTGWVVISDSWSYASATTITVPAGAASLYTKGDRIRLKQGGAFKYWVVAAVANELLTIIETDDYTLADAAITDNGFSHADKPLGFPSRFAWTTTWTGFSADPTGKLEYNVSNGMMLCNIHTYGTSNAAGFDFTLPVAETFATTGYLSFNALVYDNSSWQDASGALGIASTTVKVGKAISSISGNAFGGFTASGGKGVHAQFSYPI